MVSSQTTGPTDTSTSDAITTATSAVCGTLLPAGASIVASSDEQRCGDATVGQVAIAWGTSYGESGN